MLITVQPGNSIRLPLHTAFTLDLSALLPEEGTEWWIDLSYLYGRTGLTEVARTPEGLVTFMPSEGWNGFQVSDLGDPDGPSGHLVIYGNPIGPIQLDIFPSLDETQATPALRGTSGVDTLTFDAADPEGTTTRVIDTSGGSDVASITNGAGILLGRSGNDRLTGWNHNDALYGGGGLDTLFGGAGHDRLLGMNGDDRLFGGVGDDYLTGDAGNDSLTGGAGNDTLVSGQGMDTLRGEDGDDAIAIGTPVEVQEGDDDDLFSGTAPDPTSHSVVYGGLGNDTIDSEGGGEKARGPRVSDARAIGSVEIYGGAGNDGVYLSNTLGGEIWGGDGDDNLGVSVYRTSTERLDAYGGNGDDNVYGGYNVDIWGGTGNDTIYVFAGARATAGDGDDQITATWSGLYIDSFVGPGAEVYGGNGNDLLMGDNAADTLHGGNDMDTLNGGQGDDRLFGGTGDDSMDGDEGNDWLSGGDGNDNLQSLNEEEYTAEQNAAGLVGLADTLLGGAGDDTLSVERQGHVLYGGSGNDTLFANDSDPNATADGMYYGGDGDDMIQASGGSTAEGGAGSDTFVVNNLTGENARMTVTDFVRGEDVLGVRTIIGGVGEFIIDLSGEGPGTYTEPSVTWQQNGNDVEVYFDEDGNGYADATIVLQNTTGLQYIDLGVQPD
jgi:Ca2+-binding RTX toxin-like protein